MMNKEEIVYAAIRQIANTDKPERFAEINQTTFKIAMKVAELMQPSLPEGLGGAAKKYAKKHSSDWVEDYNDYSGYHSEVMDDEDEIYEAFKAGAEWMAGQGETLECLIDYKSGELVGINDKQSKKMLKDFCQKIGASRVIVQIRKK